MPSPPHHPFNRLPTEIFFEISSYLPTQERICFALSSQKALYSLSSAISELALPKDKPSCLRYCSNDEPESAGSLYDFYQSRHAFLKARYHFLRVLQRDTHDQWLACSHCLRLHPASAYDDVAQARSSTYPSCALGRCRVTFAEEIATPVEGPLAKQEDARIDLPDPQRSKGIARFVRRLSTRKGQGQKRFSW